MKRFLSILIVLAVLIACIAGCQGTPPDLTNPTPDTTAEPGTTAEPTPTTEEVRSPEPTTEATTEPRFDLLDSGVVVGEQAQLRYIPDSPVERAAAQQMFALGDAILLSNFYYGDTTTLQLTTFCLPDGEILGEEVFTSDGNLTLTTQGEYVAVLDGSSRLLRLFDKNLTEMARYSVEQDWYSWYISPDLQRLYGIDWETGVTVTELASGVLGAAIPNSVQTSCLDRDGNTILVQYVDLDTQRTMLADVDLETGAVSPVTLDYNFSIASFVGEKYLCQNFDDFRTYYLRTGWTDATVSVPEGYVILVNATGHLLWLGDDSLKLYDAQGTFLSGVELPQGEDIFDWDSFLWQEEVGGYLFVSHAADGTAKLYFWDLTPAVEGENLELTPYDSSKPQGSPVSAELYQRAEDLSQRYGVDIRIADQCALDYDQYTSDMITDEQNIRGALNVLEQVLAVYPEGYFEQLLYGNVRSIRIELVGNLKKKNVDPNAAFTTFAAFTQEKDSYYLMVADIYMTYYESYFHEFSHITDKRLAWDAALRTDALYSEAGWMALQPSGFYYSYSYDTLPADVHNSDYDGWFVDDYSCTFPTEDRARVMEYAMYGWDYVFENAPLRAKLDYYCRCIRDCFDTTGWPEVTAWEKPLYE